ncbi:MAG: CGNR zinc finger domain-containing protein [Pseudomonadota bacterium]
MDEAEFVLDYLNTYDPTRDPLDLLASAQQSQAFFAERQLARPDVNWDEVAPRLRESRDGLRDAFERLTEDEPDYDGLAKDLNASLSAVRWRGAVRPGEDELDIVFGPHEKQPYELRIMALATAALVRLTTEFGPERMRKCQSPPCEMLFVDQSKAGRQRYCSKRCANRVNVAAHRARQKAQA